MKHAVDPILIFSIAAPHTGHGDHRNINKFVLGGLSSHHSSEAPQEVPPQEAPDLPVRVAPGKPHISRLFVLGRPPDGRRPPASRLGVHGRRRPFGPRKVCALELAHVQVVIEPPLLQQLLVGAPLDDLPVVDDEHQVSVPDCTEPVGYHEARPPLHQP